MKNNQHPNMYYYKLGFDDTDPKAMISREWDLKGIDRWFVYKGLSVEDWPEDVTFYVEGEHLEDYLCCALPGWILISESVHKAMGNCSVEGVQFLPIQIVHKEKQLEIEPYWLLNIIRSIEALDWERTRWFHPERKEEDEHPILDIIRVALKSDSLRGIDIFRLKVKDSTGQIYISPYLKQCLETAGATSGFKFIPIPVY
jgi:hypothetical protein